MESAKETWQKVLGELQIQVSKANYNTWLKHSRGISCQEDIFVVGVPNAFVSEWLTRRLRSLIRKTLAQVTGRDVDVLFSIYNQDQGDYSLQTSQADGGTSSKIRTERFNPRYTFDNFVVSDCSRLAYAAALEVAENPGQAYNPLFIYASTGLGKTHLLHAIGRRAASSGLQVAYISAEQFTNEFILAIKNKQVEEFRNRFKGI
ncbi:MAG: DnaA/Hda family protein, partial [Chloroflexota bacterium]|nr:DnaA/Hda family protein [Chloroflexota bacterium]